MTRASTSLLLFSSSSRCKQLSGFPCCVHFLHHHPAPSPLALSTLFILYSSFFIILQTCHKRVTQLHTGADAGAVPTLVIIPLFPSPSPSLTTITTTTTTTTTITAVAKTLIHAATSLLLLTLSYYLSHFRSLSLSLPACLPTCPPALGSHCCRACLLSPAKQRQECDCWSASNTAMQQWRQ